MKIARVRLAEKFNISEYTASGSLVAFSCTQNKDIVFAVAKKELDYRDRSGFMKPTSRQGQDYAVFRSAGDDIVHLADIEDEPYNIHRVQLLTDQRILLVCWCSCYRSKHDYDKNGRIYSAAGEFLNEILLGDGIRHVQVTATGIIWTSFGDEGVGGNFGWDRPIGASGLVAWRADGEKVYEYHPTRELDFILACYALNVESDETTWCYYYIPFPLVKITSGVIEDYWNIPIRGSDGFAVHQRFALFRGGYKDHESLYLVRLDDNHVATVEKKLVLQNIKHTDRMCARGDAIFILAEGKVYEISLPALL